MSDLPEKKLSAMDEELIKLLSEHKSQIFSFIFSILQNISDAEDVFQQTCIVLWEKQSEFESGSDFVAWACKIAKFKALNLIQAKRRDHQYFSDSFLEELATRQVQHADHIETRQKALIECVDKLSEKDRLLLELCYGKNSKIKDIAVQLGRSASSVYKSLHRVRRALYTCITSALRRASR